MGIMTVGKKRSPGVQLLVDEYVSKLKHCCSVDDVLVRSNPKKCPVEDEDAAMMRHIRSDDLVVLLDENGLDPRRWLSWLGMQGIWELRGYHFASVDLMDMGNRYGHGLF